LVCSIRNCPAIGRINKFKTKFVSTFTLTNPNHNHENVINLELKKILVEKMKELILLSDRNPRWVCNKILSRATPEQASLFPNMETLYRLIRNFKLKL
jgi:hypothetical protein